jgi:hypothetical protein
MRITEEQLFKGNILIAQFHGLYYRHDWEEKFPKGYFVKLRAWQTSIDFLTDKDIVYVSQRFRYHETWPLLMEAWFCFQYVWIHTLRDENLHQSSYWKEFTTGISKEDKLMAWKGLAKGAFYYIEKYKEQDKSVFIRQVEARQKNR